MTRAERLRVLGAASVLDAAGEPVTAGPGIRAMWAPLAMAGPAFTVRTAPDDNLALHRAVAEAPAGAVIVVDAGGAGAAIFGDLLAQVALGRGLAGLVTDGLVRDTDRIRALGFPVFAAGVTLRSPAKAAWGDVGVPVMLGEARVRLGDWIVGDGDGVTVIAAGELDATLARAEAIRAREAELVRRAVAGESTVDQLGLRPR